MSLAGLITRLQTEAIAFAPSYLAAVLQAWEALGEGIFTAEGAEERRGKSDLERVGAIAILPIEGAILKHPDDWDLARGCCDVDKVRVLAEVAAADPSIEKVVLLIRSPGGSVLGVPETGAALARLSAAKPVIAWTDSVMASAAYWFGSQARRLYMAPSARVGSIGVYSLFLDASKLLEKHGINVNAISAGKWKLSGAPFRAMSDEERAMFQRSVDKIRNQFHAAVLAGRLLAGGATVLSEAMEGQVFDGEEAIGNGLCDGLVEDLGDVLRLAAAA